MPAVFIHGVPDTYRVWDPVLQELGRMDVVALALPGFGSPMPKGFTATKEEYIDWIIGQLEQQGGPVDLVGHDWGSLFTVRVASLRPDLVSTWAAGDGPVSRDYQFHELAKVWQTPSAGEEWMARLIPAQMAEQLARLGVPPELARETSAHVDAAMKDCILRLYRSALEVGREWQPALAEITAPGLVFWGKDDHACPVEFADRLASDTNAHRVLKLDAGHWSLLQKPAELADALRKHWTGSRSERSGHGISGQKKRRRAL